MRMNVYSIYDVASGAYMRPFFVQADAEAARMFSDIALDADHAIGKHPEDYSLFRVGTFDDNKAKLVGEAPECIATALEMVSAARRVKVDNLEKLDTEISNGEVGNGSQLQRGSAS